MASRELLTYVSGITPAVANNIVQYRNENGAFNSRKQLLKVKKLGPKAFEQAAGFLRIRDGKNPLDNTAVHPESYGIVDAIAADLAIPLEQIPKAADRLKRLDLKKYMTAAAGELTLRDILQELEKPGRDPREQFTYATFKEGIDAITDLSPGMALEGVVTNVTNFWGLCGCRGPSGWAGSHLPNGRPICVRPQRHCQSGSGRQGARCGGRR